MISIYRMFSVWVDGDENDPIRLYFESKSDAQAWADAANTDIEEVQLDEYEYWKARRETHSYEKAHPINA